MLLPQIVPSHGTVALISVSFPQKINPHMSEKFPLNRFFKIMNENTEYMYKQPIFNIVILYQ